MANTSQIRQLQTPDHQIDVYPLTLEESVFDKNGVQLPSKLSAMSGSILSIAGMVGEPNGIAELDSNGKVPSSQLPSSGAVTGVKGNAEQSYRTGNVNISPANIGYFNGSTAPIGGCVPASDGDPDKFLCADGSWKQGGGGSSLDYREFDLTQSSLSASVTYPQYPYEYSFSWTGATSKSFLQAVLTESDDEYIKPYALSGASDTVTMYFSEALTGTLHCVVYLSSTAEISDPSLLENYVTKYAATDTTNPSSLQSQINTQGQSINTQGQSISTLESNLTGTYNSDDVPFRFGIDASGNYGYKKAGADTVTPFREIDSIYNACVANNATPASRSESAIVDSINLMRKRAADKQRYYADYGDAGGNENHTLSGFPLNSIVIVATCATKGSSSGNNTWYHDITGMTNIFNVAEDGNGSALCFTLKIYKVTSATNSITALQNGKNIRGRIAYIY